PSLPRFLDHCYYVFVFPDFSIHNAIASHSPNKPVPIFVSSRRQTRLTALDLVSFIASSDDSKKWLHMDPEQVKLQFCLGNRSFPYDVSPSPLVRFRLHLYKSVYFFSLVLLLPQILIATSTLAWGVNFPAHLVVVKSTEFYDGKTMRYVDYPILGEF
ncbi:hypothetical protein P879_11673, partial [Paragonimus westermani]